MDRDALVPAGLVAVATIVLTSVIVGTLEEWSDLPPVVIDGIENAGLALVLVAVLVILEWLSYSRYRQNEPLHVVVDALLVASVTFVVTAGIASLIHAVALDVVLFESGGLVLETTAFGSGVAGLVAGAYAFYARNKDCYISPADRGSDG